MNDSIALDLDVNEDEITLEKFWQLADDLLYTKVYYDTDTQEYFTKRYKHAYTDNSDISKSDNKNEDCANEIYEDEDDDEYDFEICTENEINTLLVSFITLVAKYCDQLIAQVGDDSFFDSIAEYMMHFKYYKTHIDFCIRKMLSLLIYAVDSNLNNLNLDVSKLDDAIKDEVNDSIATNEKFIKIIGWIFFRHFVHYKKELLDALKQYNGFVTLCKVLKNYIAVSKAVPDSKDLFANSYKNYLKLLFDLCKNYDFSEELDVIDPNDISYLFENLKVEARDEDEINFLTFRILLVLNEQYMFKCGLKIEKDGNKNYIVDTMLKKMTYFQVFNEILILNFNREMNIVDQILMLKFLYVVFSNKVTNGLVYLNDLKVIVDIIIRQLNDLQLSKNEYLVNIYLRVLYSILTTTDLKNHKYKNDELFELFEYLINSDATKEKTKHLAVKCRECQFLQLPNTSTESLPSISSLNINGNVEGDKAAELTDKEIISKIGHGTTQTLLYPATKLLSIQSHILHQVTKSPQMVVRTLHLDNVFPNPHSPTSPKKSPGKDVSISDTPPPPPPRINITTPTPPSPSSSVTSVTSNAAPPPPPPRPSLRKHNQSADDLMNNNKNHRAKPPPPPLNRQALRNASYDAINITNRDSPDRSVSHTPLPPPPPPRPRIKTTNSGQVSIAVSHTESNNSDIRRHSGRVVSDHSDSGLYINRRQEERNGSVVSLHSTGSISSTNSGSSDVDSAVNVNVSGLGQPHVYCHGRLKRAPPPPPRSSPPTTSL